MEGGDRRLPQDLALERIPGPQDAIGGTVGGMGQVIAGGRCDAARRAARYAVVDDDLLVCEGQRRFEQLGDFFSGTVLLRNELSALSAMRRTGNLIGSHGAPVRADWLALERACRLSPVRLDLLPSLSTCQRYYFQQLKGVTGFTRRYDT